MDVSEGQHHVLVQSDVLRYHPDLLANPSDASFINEIADAQSDTIRFTDYKKRVRYFYKRTFSIVPPTDLDNKEEGGDASPTQRLIADQGAKVKFDFLDIVNLKDPSQEALHIEAHQSYGVHYNASKDLAMNYYVFDHEPFPTSKELMQSNGLQKAGLLVHLPTSTGIHSYPLHFSAVTNLLAYKTFVTAIADPSGEPLIHWLFFLFGNNQSGQGGKRESELAYVVHLAKLYPVDEFHPEPIKHKTLKLPALVDVDAGEGDESDDEERNMFVETSANPHSHVSRSIAKLERDKETAIQKARDSVPEPPADASEDQSLSYHIKVLLAEKKTREEYDALIEQEKQKSSSSSSSPASALDDASASSSSHLHSSRHHTQSHYLSTDPALFEEMNASFTQWAKKKVNAVAKKLGFGKKDKKKKKKDKKKDKKQIKHLDETDALASERALKQKAPHKAMLLGYDNAESAEIDTLTAELAAKFPTRGDDFDAELAQGSARIHHEYNQKRIVSLKEIAETYEKQLHDAIISTVAGPEEDAPAQAWIAYNAALEQESKMERYLQYIYELLSDLQSKENGEALEATHSVGVAHTTKKSASDSEESDETESEKEEGEEDSLSEPGDGFDPSDANAFTKWAKRFYKKGSDILGFRDTPTSVAPLDSYATAASFAKIEQTVTDRVGKAIERFKKPRDERLKGSVPIATKYFTVKKSKKVLKGFDKKHLEGQLLKDTNDGYLFYDMILPNGGIPIKKLGTDAIDISIKDVRKKAFPGVDSRFMVTLSAVTPEEGDPLLRKGVAYLADTIALLVTIESADDSMAHITEVVFVDGKPEERE